MSFPALRRIGFVIPKSKTAVYEGASGSRRLNRWAPSDVGPNADIENTLPVLRSRQRQQTRDNALALSAREQYVINVIGSGLRPHLTLADTGLKDEIIALWNRSVVEMDADGQLDFYGQQALLAHAMFDAGSCLARRRFRRVEDGLAVPLQIQLLEPDHMDESKDRMLPNGGKIKLGIQLTPFGQREGYWLRREHPGDGLSTQRFESSFIPADDIAHVFRVRRPGQLTGTPHLHAAMVILYELDKYLDAELVRKQQAAMHVGAITNGSGDATPEAIWNAASDRNWPQARNEFYAGVGGLSAGSWTVLAPGDEVTFNSPQDVGANFEPFIASYHRQIAAAAGITYEQLTGKMTDVNYSSARVRLIDIRRGFEMDQRQVIGFQFCRKVWSWWLDAAVASGRLRIPSYQSQRYQYQPAWVPQPFEHIDPVKDLVADVGAVRAGFKTHEDLVMEWGGDPSTHYPIIERINRHFDELGLVFDTDPRRTTDSGVAQAVHADAIQGGP